MTTWDFSSGAAKRSSEAESEAPHPSSVSSYKRERGRSAQEGVRENEEG